MTKRFLLPGLWLSIALVMAGCGSGGSGGGGEIDDPIVTTETVTPTPTDTPPQQEPTQSVEPEFIPAGGASAQFVAQGGEVLYRVPSGAQVTLTSLTGNADLFLFDNENLDNLLCAAARPFAEDSCSATDSDGEVIAVVFGREVSGFDIGVSADCSVEAVNRWVYRNMKDYYLYADEVPDVDPASYASTADLMRDLRFNELDPFSGVSNAAQRQAFLEEGASFGFGFNLQFDADLNTRVIFVYADSPAGRAGIKRGDILVGLNNELWNDISNDRLQELIGTQDNPLPNEWQFIDGETAEAKSVSLTQSEYRLNTVLHSSVWTNQSFDGATGYIVFNNFLRTSEAELDATINSILDRGATELVLDLRYNPGGFISIASKLASQIGGSDLAGNLLVRYEYNDKYTSQNDEILFEVESPILNFDRVVFLTTGRTASASELLISALSPYIDVTVMGQRTSGKPFISVANEYCGQSLSAMEAQGVNQNGVTVAGGIAPNCFAADDVTRDFGGSADGIEGMLESALDYVVFGICDTNPVLSKQPSVLSSRISESPFTGAVLDTR